MTDTSFDFSQNNISESVAPPQAPKRMREIMQASYIESTCKTPRLSNYESPQRLVMLIDKRFEKQNELIQTLIKESETRLLHELDKRISDFQSEITSLKERIVNMETVADKINVIEKDIFELKSQKMVYPQNSELENEIKILKAQLAKQENFHVASELRINGIPSYNGENLNILFSNICNCFNIPTPTVKSIYRLKNKIRQNNDATIIVDLMSSYDKNYILKSMAFFKRTNKTPLLLNHIGFDSNYVVHINENLTAANYKILQSALKLKRQKYVDSAYSFRGLIYVKKMRSDPPQQIDDIEQLNKFFRQSDEIPEQTSNISSIVTDP